MSTLEERLRRDLQPLADALIAAPDSSGSENAADESNGGSSVVGAGRFRTRKTGRAIVGAAAAAVLVAVGVVVLQNDDSATTVDTAEVPAPDSFGTWSAIPDAPMAPRAYPVGAWTGSEALFWAGSTLDRGFAHSDAAIYDPGSETWRTAPEPGWGHPGLVGAVFDGSLYAVAKGGGARFDLDSEEWVDLPQVDDMYFSGIVASDDAIWALGPTATNPEGQPDLAVVRYDPTIHEWVHGPVFEGSDETSAALASLQSLEQAPVWTGTDLVVWGDRSGIAFDPEQAEWTVLPRLQAPEGDVVATEAVANGDGLSVVAHIRDSDGLHLGIAHLEATTSQWTWKAQDIPWIDLSAATVVPAGPWIVLLPADGPPITVHTRSGAWQRHDDAPIAGVRGPGTVWTGTQLIVWGGEQEDTSGDDPTTGMIWSPPSNESARATPESPDEEFPDWPELRIVDGTTRPEWGTEVANTLARGTCGFDTRLVQDPPKRPTETSVVATEQFTDLGAQVAEIIGTNLTTVMAPVQGEDGHLADIVVDLGPDFVPGQLDPSGCPIEELWITGGPPPPGTPPLFNFDFERVDGSTATARIDIPFRMDSEGICISFPTGAAGCGGVGQGAQLLRPFAGTSSDTERLLAVTGPGRAVTFEATDGSQVSPAAGQLLPDPYQDRSVAVIDISRLGEITALIARDAGGNELARNEEPDDLAGLNEVG